VVRGHFDTSTKSSHVYSEKSQNYEMSMMLMEFALCIMLHTFVMGDLKTIEFTISAHLGGIFLNGNDVKGCN
jgi:hypothetical protein